MPHSQWTWGNTAQLRLRALAVLVSTNSLPNLLAALCGIALAVSIC